MKPSLNPVAAALGVSRATVYRVLAEQPLTSSLGMSVASPNAAAFL
jgi:predicted DNA-binding transcriptional regulator AlpA